jgi:hypothetical protein
MSRIRRPDTSVRIAAKDEKQDIRESFIGLAYPFFLESSDADVNFVVGEDRNFFREKVASGCEYVPANHKSRSFVGD